MQFNLDPCLIISTLRNVNEGIDGEYRHLRAKHGDGEDEEKNVRDLMYNKLYKFD